MKGFGSKRRIILLGLGGFLPIVVILYLFSGGFSFSLEKKPELSILKQSVEKGMTFIKFAVNAGVPTSTAVVLIEVAKPAYDLAKIVAGRETTFSFNKESGQLVAFHYPIDSEEELILKEDVSTSTELWSSIRQPIPYEIATSTIAGVIESSLWQAVASSTENGDPRLALAIGEMFAWQVDFAADVQRGDSFKVVYEKRFLNGEYAMPGKILAAYFVNEDKKYYGFHFKGGKTEEGYYDENGNSLQKVFLKAPLQYKYISSGFSYARVNPVTKSVSAHRGIDYAAPYGTPAVSVGDGTVIQAGWNGPYGLSVMVRHNDVYVSRYGHFQSLPKGIRVGAKVKQGQIVGYVGATGQATGPHLHYEIHKYGSYVNPFRLEVPPGKPVNEADKENFDQLKAELLAKLD